MATIIHVAVGVIVNDQQQVLIAKRPSHADHGNLWEFPGGKKENGETIYEALCRELKEEINLDVLSASPFLKISHDYPKYSVLLDCWRVDAYQSDNLHGAEGQTIEWVDLTALKERAMPAANLEILAELTSTTHQPGSFFFSKD